MLRRNLVLSCTAVRTQRSISSKKKTTRQSSVVQAASSSSHAHEQPSLLSLATSALVHKKQTSPSPSTSLSSASSTFGLESTHETKAPWIDRDAERIRALMEHRRSDEYVELHRRANRHSDLGLYGGEAGFEKVPRVWVDPDNPHVPAMYTTAPLAVNVSWTRYGHFKRELHIIDIDKLCRHARMVPPIDRLLTDLVTARVALDDDDCSALVRHGARSLYHLEGRPREEFYQRIVECFERFLISIAPPMFAGTRTHADMIRVCAMCKKWKDGYSQYFARAVEEARHYCDDDDDEGSTTTTTMNGDDHHDHHDRKSNNNIIFELDADIYDAVIELCVACNEHEKALEEFRNLLRSGHRPRLSSFTNALVAATATADAAAGDDIPRLLHLYQREPDAQYFEARAAFAATVAPHHEVCWANLRDALAAVAPAVSVSSTTTQGGGHHQQQHHAGASGPTIERHHHVTTGGRPEFGGTTSTMASSSAAAAGSVATVTGRMVSWTLLAVSKLTDSSTPQDVESILAVAQSRGIPCDYEQLTFALVACCAATTRTTSSSSSPSRDGGGGFGGAWVALAVRIITQMAASAHVNITPEMALLAVRCFAQQQQFSQQGTSADLVSVAFNAIAAAELTNRHSELFPAIYYALFQLLARAGAMATFSSTQRKYVLSRDATVSGWLLRTWLWCNSIAAPPNGGHRGTEEALEFLRLGHGADTTKELVAALALCRVAHGAFPKKVCRAMEEFELYQPTPSAEDEKVKEEPVSTTTMTTITLLDLVEECADLIVVAQQKDHSADAASSAAATTTMSLAQTLASLGGAQGGGGGGGGGVVEKKQHRGRENDNFRSDEEIVLSSVTLPYSFRDAEACEGVAEFLISRMMLLQLQQLQPVASSKKQQQKGQQQNRKSAIIAELFLGLPEEKQEGSEAAELVKEFAPTPTSLRDLRVKWTMNVDDVRLKRFGQLGRGSVMPTKAHDLAIHAQPFGGNA